MTRQKIIFFGNGPLADFALETLSKNHEIIFHAREKSDLEQVKKLKTENPDAHGVLASFGVMIKSDVLELFEPEGILNIHPSLLPLYRGPSPIESAILNGDRAFGVSVMKLVEAMDAGPIYYQAEFKENEIFGGARDAVGKNNAADERVASDTRGETSPLDDASLYKTAVYQKLSTAGAEWIAKNLENLPTPAPQDDARATYTKKLDVSMSPLRPDQKSATELLQEIRAFSKFPKSKCEFFGLDCTVISAHVAENASANNARKASAPSTDGTHVATTQEAENCISNVYTLYIQCHDNSILIIDKIQPAGRKIMDAKSFINGYGRKK